jgi:AcrR family transcriptional regulator
MADLRIRSRMTPHTRTLESERRERISEQDWVSAALELMAAHGLRAVTINAVCRRVNLPRERFYRFFDDMATLRKAMVASWAHSYGRNVPSRDQGDMSSPRQRLASMLESLSSPRHRVLERAMREWARSDASVGTALRVADRQAVADMHEVFLAAGFDPAGAAVRANTLFAAFVGYLHLTGANPGSAVSSQREDLLDLFLDDPRPLR